jgi:hypothetical protein
MMQSAGMRYEPTKRTPWIIMEPGKVFIMGRSIPENPGDFYRPVLKWISDYALNYSGKTKINLGFEYINTSSTKWIFTLLKELSDMKDVKENARVTWYYENGDDDMCELGFILRSLIDCPFIVVEVAQMNRDRYNKILSESK